MRLVFALLTVLTLAACQVTTSQSMGSGVTIRSSAPIGKAQGTEDQTTDDQGAEATED